MTRVKIGQLVQNSPKVRENAAKQTKLKVTGTPFELFWMDGHYIPAYFTCMQKITRK
jgi:hypothetical protein